MKAAVVSSFDQPPTCREVPLPIPANRDEMLVDVLAAGLHPRVRSQANGSHYTSNGKLPLVPGIDGVGRGPDGKLRYFVLDDTTMGSMAEHTVIETDRSIVLPRDSDPVAIAAAMNPAMGSWLALRCRVPFRKRQQVLILGATGNAGRMAVQVARHLGAGQIIAAGRSDAKLAGLLALGATAVVNAADPHLGELAREVDIVLDFVWGEASAQAMTTMVTHRADRSQPLTWVQIGSVSAPTAPILSAPLRAARLQIVGSGIGSVPGREIVGELPALVKAITAGTFAIDATTVRLQDVEQAWLESGASRRVITP